MLRNYRKFRDLKNNPFYHYSFVAHKRDGGSHGATIKVQAGLRSFWKLQEDLLFSLSSF